MAYQVKLVPLEHLVHPDSLVGLDQPVTLDHQAHLEAWELWAPLVTQVQREIKVLLDLLANLVNLVNQVCILDFF